MIDYLPFRPKDLVICFLFVIMSLHPNLYNRYGIGWLTFHFQKINNTTRIKYAHLMCCAQGVQIQPLSERYAQNF